MAGAEYHCSTYNRGRFTRFCFGGAISLALSTVVLTHIPQVMQECCKNAALLVFFVFAPWVFGGLTLFTTILGASAGREGAKRFSP